MNVYSDNIYTVSIILNILVTAVASIPRINASPPFPTSSSLCLSLLSLLLDVSLIVDVQRCSHSAANQLN